MQKVAKAIRESENPKYKIHFTYIEKNPPPKALLGTVELIEEIVMVLIYN